MWKQRLSFGMLMLWVAFGLLACGDDEETGEQSSDQSGDNSSEGITVVDDTPASANSPFQLGRTDVIKVNGDTIMFLGALTNTGQDVICFVRLDTITFFDASDTVIATEDTYVQGIVRKLSASQTSTCLAGGQTGEFVVFVDVKFDTIAKISVVQGWRDYANQAPDTVVDLGEGPNENREDSDRAYFSGTLVNQGEEDAVAAATTIQFFIKDEDGKYIDWDFDTKITSESILSPGTPVAFESQGFEIQADQTFQSDWYIAWDDPEFENARSLATMTQTASHNKMEKKQMWHLWNALQSEQLQKEQPSRGR